MNNNMSEPKIKKKGNKFVYFNENGDSMGSINIDTEKFIGATFCMMQLHEHLDKHKQTPEYKEREKKRLEKSIQEATEKFHENLKWLESLQ